MTMDDGFRKSLTPGQIALVILLSLVVVFVIVGLGVYDAPTPQVTPEHQEELREATQDLQRLCSAVFERTIDKPLGSVSIAEVEMISKCASVKMYHK